MKVGDKITRKKYPGMAKIIEVKVTTSLDEKDKPITRVSYLAMDETTNHVFRFYGYDIGTRIFKVESTDSEQIKMFN